MKDTTQMDIKKYWQIILRRKYLFIAVSLICLSVIVWGSFFMPKIYEAKSTVFIEENIINRLVKGIAITPSIEERLRVLTFAMLSRSMILEVIDALDLDVKAKSQAEIESMVKDFQENTKITVKGAKGTDLFIVSYKGRNPKVVRDYVNTLIGKYIEENTSAKREETFSANQFLSEQINYYKKKLEESEERLARFRREKGIYLAIDENTLVTSLREYRNEMENVDMEIKKLEAKKERIKQQLSGEAPLTLALINKEEGSLSGRLKVLEQNLLMLLTKYTENYPEVIKTKAEIETIKKQLEAQRQNPEKVHDNESDLGTSAMNPVYQQLKEELFKTESEIDSMRAKLAILNNRFKKLESELKNIPEDKKELANLERDRNTYQEIYGQLLARLGQAEVSEQMEIQDKGTNFRIVDPAILPIKPVSPNRVKFILFGIFAGVAAGIGAVLLREHLDNSIRDVDTLKTQLGMNVLAIIPEIVTEQDIEKKRRLDRRVYGFSIAYLLIIGGLFIKEVIDRIWFS